MYGVEVDIWADTGEVRSVSEAWSSMPEPNGDSDVNIDTIQDFAENQTRVLVNQASLPELNLVDVVVFSSIFCVMAIFFRFRKSVLNAVCRKPRFRVSRLLLVFVLLALVLFPLKQ